MRWFKHYANASHSESLSKLKESTGHAGYGRYWDLMEFLCQQFDGESTNFRIPEKALRLLFQIHSKSKLSSFAIQLNSVEGLSIVQRESVFEVDAPILLELLSRDFKKARIDRAQTAPKNKIKELDKDKEITNVMNEIKISLPAVSEIVPVNQKEILVQEPEIKSLAKRTKTHTDDLLNQKLRECIACYANSFKAKYGHNAELVGKDIGLLKSVVKTMSAEKVCILIQAYLQMSDPYFEKLYHNIPTFCANLNKISVAAQSGVDPNNDYSWLYKKDENLPEGA